MKFKTADDLQRWNMTYSRRIMLRVRFVEQYVDSCDGGSSGQPDSALRLLQDQNVTGDVLVISNYKPQYWLYETGRNESTYKVPLGEEGLEMSFMNTHKVLLLFPTPGKYEVDYWVWTR